MKRLIDLFIMGGMLVLFIVCMVLGLGGAWWNIYIAIGLLLIGIALYCEMKNEDLE